MNKNLIKTNMNVVDNNISVIKIEKTNYISLTDLAKYSNPENPANVIIHWMSNKGTIDYIGLWEELNNSKFNLTKFREIKNKEVGYSSFTMSPKRWIQTTNAIGMMAKGGKYSIGCFAHPDLAFEFASWLSPEFKLYLIKEFERLKQKEAKQNRTDWKANRIIAKANYLIHTDSINENIIPNLSSIQKKFIYAEEADVLNVALFGISAKEWKRKNPNLNGNIRDYATLKKLLMLSNLESINAELIHEGISQQKRLEQLNKSAIRQLRILNQSKQIMELENLNEDN